MRRPSAAPRTCEPGPFAIPARNGRCRIVSSSRASSSPERASGAGSVSASHGSSPSGNNESAPATSAPIPANNRKVLVGDTPSPAAAPSRWAPSGNSPSKNGRQSRGLKLRGCLGSEKEIGGAEASSIQSRSYVKRTAPSRFRESEPTIALSHQTFRESVIRKRTAPAWPRRLPRRHPGAAPSLVAVAPPGNSTRTLQPSVPSTASSFSSRTVALPLSSSETNRTPTPAAPAS